MKATIKSDRLEVTVNRAGGAFDSVIDLKSGEQLLWQGNENSWPKKDLVLFPFVCRRRDGWYAVDGRRYDADLHGFAKDSVFEIESISEDSVTLWLSSNAETKRIFPFDFELRVKYGVENACISIEYAVKNTGTQQMYYCIGGHFGVRLNAQDGDTNGSYACFEKPVCGFVTLRDNFTTDRVRFDEPINKVELNKALMKKYITLITEDCGMRSVTVQRKGGADMRFTGDSPVMSFWSTTENGEFYCVEPWWGLPDELENTVRELKDKPYATALAPGESKKCGYKVEVL